MRLEGTSVEGRAGWPTASERQLPERCYTPKMVTAVLYFLLASSANTPVQVHEAIAWEYKCQARCEIPTQMELSCGSWRNLWHHSHLCR